MAEEGSTMCRQTYGKAVEGGIWGFAFLGEKIRRGGQEKFGLLVLLLWLSLHRQPSSSQFGSILQDSGITKSKKAEFWMGGKKKKKKTWRSKEWGR